MSNGSVFWSWLVKQYELRQPYSFHIYSLVQGHAVLPQFVDVSIISVCSLSITTAMKVKDFLNSAESEVRSGWTEQHSAIDLHWFFKWGLIREALVTEQGRTGLLCVFETHHSPWFELRYLASSSLFKTRIEDLLTMCQPHQSPLELRLRAWNLLAHIEQCLSYIQYSSTATLWRLVWIRTKLMLAVWEKTLIVVVTTLRCPSSATPF